MAQTIPVPKWIDTKDALLQILMNGYAGMGFGIIPLDIAPVDDEHPSLSFYRAQGQEISDRPVLTVRRTGGTATARWLGNVATPMDALSQSNPMRAIPLEQSFEIVVDSANDTGAQSTCDWLIELASGLLLSSYDAMTFPLEVGGYGFYFPAWRLLQDAQRPFTQVSGKILFRSGLQFSCTRLIGYETTPPSNIISGFGIIPTALPD